MLRRSRAFLLLAVLLWQSLGMLGSMAVTQKVSELEHLIAHGQGASHHHHADRAWHMGDDDGPVQHLHADSGANTAALLGSTQPALAGVRSMSPPETSRSRWLSPTLEGPLRPPMQRA